MNGRQISGHVLRSATFGCVPVSDDERTRARLIDLCAALGESLELPVRSHRAPSGSALANAYRAGRVHLAWVSPVAAATDPALGDATPLVRSVRRGAAGYHGVLFARRDGPVESLADLAGARAAWVSPSSASGYLFVRAALQSEGLDLDALLAAQSFLGSHGAVADAVARGDADVGATFATFEGGDPRGRMVAGFDDVATQRDEFRVLSTTETIPSDVVVASPALMSTLHVDPVEALSRLHHDVQAAAAMRHVLGAERFEKADREAIEALRAQLDSDVSAAG